MSQVRLPSAVRRQGEAADAALRELQNPTGIDNGQYVGTGEPTTDTGIAEPDGEALETAAEEATPDYGEDEGQESQGSVDWEAEAKAMREERDKAVAAFNTLNGKYRAEVPRLHEELKTLRAELEQAKAGSAAPAESSFEVDGKSEAELREMYGDEIVDRLLATERRAVEAAKRELEPSLKRLQEIEQRDARNAEDAMFASIEKVHPDWAKVNELASWHKFLAEVNPDTGETRQAAINRAQHRLDPEPIIRQLSTFKRRTKRGNQALETQVVPGDTGRTEAPKQADQKVYEAGKIDAFFKQVAVQKSRGIPLSDEFKRLESTYTKAMLEGRVS